MEYVRKVHIYKNHKNGNCAARESEKSGGMRNGFWNRIRNWSERGHKDP